MPWAHTIKGPSADGPSWVQETFHSRITQQSHTHELTRRRFLLRQCGHLATPQTTTPGHARVPSEARAEGRSGPSAALPSPTAPGATGTRQRAVTTGDTQSAVTAAFPGPRLLL